jgi:hypothetical protein
MWIRHSAAQRCAGVQEIGRQQAEDRRAQGARGGVAARTGQEAVMDRAIDDLLSTKLSTVAAPSPATL